MRRLARLWCAVLIVAGCASTANEPPRISPPGVATPNAPTPSFGPSDGPTAIATAARPPLAPATGLIAFLHTDTTTPAQPRDVYVVEADGSNLLQITDDDRVESELFWLEDGSRLVFAWETREDPYHQFLASVRPDGTDRVELGAVQTAYSTPAPSPDGRYIAFGGDGDNSGRTGLVLLDRQTGARRQLTTDGAADPIWSPDGTRLLAVLPSRWIGVVELVGGGTSALIHGDADLIGWTDDGASILYRICDDSMGKFECMDAPVTIAGADGSNPRVFGGPMPMRQFGILSPDGASIAEVLADCSVRMMPASEVATIGLDEWRLRTAACERLDSLGSWSPDSRWFALSHQSDTGWVIGLVSPISDAQRLITEAPEDQGPAWRPE